MQSRRIKISPATINGLKAGELIWDTELSRFGARRRATKVSFVLKVRIDGRQRWITLGHHGPLTPAEARERARRTLAEIDCGCDPTRERESRRSMPTLEDFTERWLAEHVALKRKPTTLEEYRRIVTKYIRPRLGRVPVDRISRADVVALHVAIALRPYQANRVVAVMSAIMSYAERIGFRTPISNPCRGLERFAEAKRKRPLTTTELTRLWRHLAEIEGIENLFVLAAVRLLLLTGCRKNEILTLRWSEVDIEDAVIRLRDAKSGPRCVILSDQALAILNSLPRIKGNPFVIVGEREGRHLVNLSRPWERICERLGLTEVRLHDLRHTVGSRLARKAPLTVVRDTLGHAAIQTTSGYSHAAIEDVRTAVNELGREITGGT